MESRPVEPRDAPRILVVGCGGIGGVLLSYLLEAGHAVTAVAHREAIAQALTERGPVLKEGLTERRVRGELSVHVRPPSPDAAGRFDLVLLATPPDGVEEAARSTQALLSPDGVMVCFQNGLCEDRVAAVIGPERVLGAVVAWGASSPAPGVYERTSAGGFTVGTLSGEETAPLERLGRLLAPLGPVDKTRNLLGARWSKLAINCAVSSLGTAGGERVGALLVHRHVRRLALEVMTEVVQVAQRSGVRLEKVSGTLDLNWLALTDEERRIKASPSLLAKHSVLLAVGAKYRRLRSSMLAAIERGREPPVDFLNGEVVSRAQALGLEAPINARLQALIHAIARRNALSSPGTLRQLYEETRGEVSRLAA